jgi:hypothetical protein
MFHGFELDAAHLLQERTEIGRAELDVAHERVVGVIVRAEQTFPLGDDAGAELVGAHRSR